MADQNILVYKFSELERCSSRMGQVTEALERLHSTAENAKNSVCDYWQGDAYEAFIDRFSKLQGALEKLHEQIDRNKQKLDKAIALEKENEQSLSSQTVGGLSADNIF